VDTAQNAPETVFLAGDEASLYLQASVMRVYSPVGETPVIKVAANRENTHFYGALNLLTGKEITMRSDLMISEVSALFLARLLLAYPNKPILLFWDRATWHKGEGVRAILEANPRLEVVWFPAGSPELNPQEHVWKAARTSVSHNHRHKKLPELADAFEMHLKTTRFPCSLLEKHGYLDICAMLK
jgi:transposase